MYFKDRYANKFNHISIFEIFITYIAHVSCHYQQSTIPERRTATVPSKRPSDQCHHCGGRAAPPAGSPVWCVLRQRARCPLSVGSAQRVRKPAAFARSGSNGSSQAV